MGPGLGIWDPVPEVIPIHTSGTVTTRSLSGLEAAPGDILQAVPQKA